ncbi:MAG: hypothetical protein A3B78_00540 [Omnitrophica WOR_2 bacterium RIFCSPHIGHO2_02_FULL_67_20]|nr:MAG: hypothetical protein A3B78_00540 [Omnitrophica WOR_2 bacterium RIFCSPHIGHO2_02_FULL_67_20]
MRIYTASYRRTGRLVPKRKRGLRAGSVILRPGTSMPWHSTKEREELIIALAGRVHLDVEDAPGRRRQTVLSEGRCALLPPRTPHAVSNHSRRTARYLYVTGK